MNDNLTSLRVLLLDCQATGADPERNSLLEMGWSVINASGSENDHHPPVVSHIIAQSPETEIPGRVRRITGITDDMTAGGDDPASLWAGLTATAAETAALNGMDMCPTVIHYARFEEPWLRRLHDRFSPGTTFPFRIVCTHEIARRLLPWLPRRGLRAVAGYFGHGAGELRRSKDHVEATAVIWRSFVEKLAAEHGIVTLESLESWIAGIPAPARSGRTYLVDRETRLALPDRPGIYRMLRSNGDILYVGKAKSLRRRVNSYFTKQSGHPEHILEMLSQATGFDVESSGSALEAAIREHDEIKRIAPPYNRALRESERTLAFCSRDFTAFSCTPDDDHPIGPITSREAVAPLALLTPAVMDARLPEEAMDSAFPCEALGIPEKYAPDPRCFGEGFEIFIDRRRSIITSSPLERVLVRLGYILRLERLNADEDETGDTDLSESDGAGDTQDISSGDGDGEWTPEHVADAVEGTIRRAMHTIRRARWYCRLSESALVWRRGNDPNDSRRFIIIVNGALAEAGELGDSEYPVPRNYRRSVRERQQCFDIAAYDRLRVLTTEMRRLVSEERDIGLVLTPTLTIGCKSLATLLVWV